MFRVVLSVVGVFAAASVTSAAELEYKISFCPYWSGRCPDSQDLRCRHRPVRYGDLDLHRPECDLSAGRGLYLQGRRNPYYRDPKLLEVITGPATPCWRTPTRRAVGLRKKTGAPGQHLDAWTYSRWIRCFGWFATTCKPIPSGLDGGPDPRLHPNQRQGAGSRAQHPTHHAMGCIAPARFWIARSGALRQPDS